MRFAMEFFVSYPLASNSIWFSIYLGAIIVAKHQMPFGMSEL